MGIFRIIFLREKIRFKKELSKKQRQDSGATGLAQEEIGRGVGRVWEGEMR
jgi:hypothetical protein